MKAIAAAIYFFTKRQLKQISFWGILLMFPVFTIFFSQVNKTDNTGISIALYAPGESESLALVQKLSQHKGNFTFYICNTAEALYEDVSTQKAECGYILPKDLFDKLDANKKNNLVDVVMSPSTTMSKIINEVVYSEIFEEYSLHLLKKYVITESPLSDDTADASSINSLEKEIDSLYRRHMTDGSTFSFAYQTQAVSTNAVKTETASLLLAPIRGLIAVFIFLSGFCGALNYYKDKETHVFDNRNLTSRHFLHLLSISIPVFLTSVTGLLVTVQIAKKKMLNF